MAMAWPDSPAYDSLAPQFDSPAPAPPAAKFDANVERWRPMVQKYFQPQDVDKALYVVQHESGGNPSIMNGDAAKNGPSPGLFQITAANAKAAGIDGTDPEQAVKWAATQVAHHGWTDWGEGTNYKGVNFGALGGANPFGPGGTGVNDIGRITGGLVGKTIASLKPAAYSAFKPSVSDATETPAPDSPMLGVASAPTAPQDAPAGLTAAQDAMSAVAPSTRLTDGVATASASLPSNEALKTLDGITPIRPDIDQQAPGSLRQRAIDEGAYDNRTFPIAAKLKTGAGNVGASIAGVIPDFKIGRNPYGIRTSYQNADGTTTQQSPGINVSPKEIGRGVAESFVPASESEFAQYPVTLATNLQGAEGLTHLPGLLRGGVKGLLRTGGGAIVEDVGEGAAKEVADNAPLPGQRGLFDQPAPRIEHDAAIANKFITAAEAEAKLRTSGVIDNEIRAGRAQQAQGIMGSMQSGQSLEDAGRASSEGAYQGGSLRKTFIPKIDISPEEGQKLVGSLHDQMIAGEITPFEYKQLVQPSGIVNRLTSDTPHLQPAEIRLVHRVFGGEANASLEDIAHELQQVQGLGHPKTEFPLDRAPHPVPGKPGVLPVEQIPFEPKPKGLGYEGTPMAPQEWPPTSPNAAPEGLRPRSYKTVVTHDLDESAPLAGQPGMGLASPIGEGGTIPTNAFRAESPEEIAAARKAMGIRENAHKFADTSFSVARQIVNEVQGLTGASMTLKSSLSPPIFRQGLVRMVTNPVAAMREFGQSLTAARSIESFEKVNQLLKDNPWSSIKIGPNEQFSPFRGYTIEDLAGAKDASRTVKGFKLREVGGGVAADARAPEFQGLNESRVSRAVERIPGIGLSDRQAAAGFNANVVGRYSEVAGKKWAMEEALGLPHDRREYSAILDTVLHQQQYGGLTQKNIPALFSTRALSGRVQSLADVFVQPGSIFQPSARQEAVKGLMSVVGFNTAMIGLVSQVPGFSVKWQSGLPTLLGPGGLHVDPWAGYNAIVKLPMKIGRDLDKELGHDGWQKNANWDNVFHKVASDGVAFARNQLGPITGKLADIGTGKDYLGKPYSLTGDVESGQFFRDLAAPFVTDDIIQSFAEDGLRGVGLTTPLSAFSAGVGNYTTTGEARDTAARQVGPDANGAYPTKTGAKPGSYEDLMPEARMQVDSTDAVTKARGGPTPYQASNTADRADTVAEVSRQEQLHDQGKNTKKLSDVYHDAGVANRATAKALENQFADEFAGFDKDKYEKAVEGYYNQEKTIPEGEDDAGGHDFDATAAAQADYLAKLPPEQRAWVTQALGLSEAKKTKTQQAYDKYIADKKAAGYFDIDPKDPDGAKKRETLNRANPDLDYQAWQFNSTSGKGGKSLETIAAVNKALADPLSKNVPVKMAGLGRAVNESEGTTAAFKDTLGKSDSLGERAQKFLSGFQVERDKERIAQEVYHKSYASMTDSEQQAVANRIRRSVLASSPDLEAYLAWMGQRDTISASSTAIDTLRMLRQRYGRETGRTEKNPIKFSE